MEYEKQPTAQSNLYPTAPAGDPYPPPYAAFQSPPPGGVAYPQAPPQQQPAYNQPYPSASPQQPYGQPGYPGAGSGPPAYGYPAPGAAGYRQQPQMVVMAPQPQTIVVARQDSVSMIGAIVLSCFVFWCCGCLIGLVAFILAMVGQSTSSSGNAKSSIQLRNASYAVSIVGIIIGIIIIILLFVFRH